MKKQTAAKIMDELIELLVCGSVSSERSIDKYYGSFVNNLQHPISRKAIHEKADILIRELRDSWGPTVNPSLGGSIAFGTDEETEVGITSHILALFHKSGIWGYVRMRKTETESSDIGCLELILGVAKDRQEKKK